MPIQRLTRDRDLGRSTMRDSVRSGAGSRTSVRAGTRLSTARYAPTSSSSSSLAAPLTRTRAASPADSFSSSMTAGTKRKERDFDSDAGSSAAGAPSGGGGGEETNINVVVRCRGRSAREVKENSTVVVRTDGLQGKRVELSMGASALSNKSYSFDRVFSQAADQNMIFDDTVKPILDEMLAGYNCTIFAYGQTGTGKTYTMSGDMTDTLGMLSDEAGIIPRVLQQLFHKLKIEGSENLVKCSFIELYNEELRDLLSVDESAKLKIYDDASRRGHLSTVVQGMEEKHIGNATEGIKVLQDGSLKRQVAATKCNDLSSRSHTVFTISAYHKKTNDQGVDELISAGKLNLVDLAGSENIQRSGAENKRAAEAGLINKSLLTLGRVINALVDRSSHIPYRESKLTRLLQDSLGGRTKTCIIATISPAKTNLEETISTLEYAFRAKNIKNKPQMNPLLNKMTLLRDLSGEIEKLKSELISTRQRNGVYLSNESYEEMTATSESRRIVMEEQGAKMETLETNLRSKVQELYSLTTNFMDLKKDHEDTKGLLDNTKEILDQTEDVLSATRKTLAEETQLRKAHEQTEEKLTEIGGELIHKLHKTVHDVNGLHAKNKRKSDLQSVNRAAWGTSQVQVADVTSMVERRIHEFEEEQRDHIDSISQRMEAFVGEELDKLSTTQQFLEEQLGGFTESKKLLQQKKTRSKEDMDLVLEEIKGIRDTVKEQVGDSLQVISQAAQKISADVVTELTEFHNELHNSYSTLGKDFKTIFDDLVKHITAQRSEADSLRRQLMNATTTIGQQNASVSARMQETLEEERRLAAEDRQKLVAQFTSLLNAQAETQEARFAERNAQIQKSLADSGSTLDNAMTQHGEGMDAWDENEAQLLETVKKSRDQLKTKLKDDWTGANEHSTSIQNTAKTVHAETVRVVDEQTEALGEQMTSLDDFVTRARTENASQHEAQTQSVQVLSSAVEQSFGNISSHFKTTFDRVKNLGEEMDVDANDLKDGLEPLESNLCLPLSNLREDISSTALQEYQQTGDTPQKIQYHYTTRLPRTSAPDDSVVRTDEDPEPELFEADEAATDNASSTLVFMDLDQKRNRSPSHSSATSMMDKSHSALSLREVDPNLTANLTTGALMFDPAITVTSAPADHTLPLVKNKRTARGTKKQAGLVAEGRENLISAAFAQAGSRRKSPRLN